MTAALTQNTLPQGQDVTKSASYKLGNRFVTDQAKKHDAMSLSLSKTAAAVADMLIDEFTLFLLGMERAIDGIKQDAEYAPLIKSIQNRRSELKRVHAIAFANDADKYGFDKEGIIAMFTTGNYHATIAKLPKLTNRGGAGRKAATVDATPAKPEEPRASNDANVAAATLDNGAAFTDLMSWFKSNKQAMSDMDKVKLATFLMSDLTASKSKGVADLAKLCFDSMVAARKSLEDAEKAAPAADAEAKAA